MKICSDCDHWALSGSDHGFCNRFSANEHTDDLEILYDEEAMIDEDLIGIETHETFGCNRHGQSSAKAKIFFVQHEGFICAVWRLNLLPDEIKNPGFLLKHCNGNWYSQNSWIKNFSDWQEDEKINQAACEFEVLNIHIIPMAVLGDQYIIDLGFDINKTKDLICIGGLREISK